MKKFIVKILISTLAISVLCGCGSKTQETLADDTVLTTEDQTTEDIIEEPVEEVTEKVVEEPVEEISDENEEDIAKEVEPDEIETAEEPETAPEPAAATETQPRETGNNGNSGNIETTQTPSQPTQTQQPSTGSSGSSNISYEDEHINDEFVPIDPSLLPPGVSDGSNLTHDPAHGSGDNVHSAAELGMDPEHWTFE